jgi:hypothetical protein
MALRPRLKKIGALTIRVKKKMEKKSMRTMATSP